MVHQGAWMPWARAMLYMSIGAAIGAETTCMRFGGELRALKAQVHDLTVEVDFLFEQTADEVARGRLRDLELDALDRRDTPRGAGSPRDVCGPPL